jgi:hypothetical protein
VSRVPIRVDSTQRSPSASVQETILLVTLRLVACLDRVPAKVVTAVEDLRHRSGRHIHNVSYHLSDLTLLNRNLALPAIHEPNRKLAHIDQNHQRSKAP